MERITAILSARRARLGLYSSNRTPGTVVWVLMCDPPVGRPVFGSHVSN